MKWEEHQDECSLACSDSSDSRYKGSESVDNSESGGSFAPSSLYTSRMSFPPQPRVSPRSPFIDYHPYLSKSTPRLRGFIDAVDGLSRTFGWKPQTPARALRRQEKRRVGHLDFNQSAELQDIWPQNIAATILRMSTGPTILATEIPWQCRLGSILADSISTSFFPSQW